MIQRRIKFWVGVILGLGISMGGLAQPRLTIEFWKTPTGVPVYFVSRPEIPMVDIAVVFSAGSARDGKQWGIASFVASMLDEGTSQKTSKQIAQGFDQVGAHMDASVDRDKAMVHLRSMTADAYLNPALQLFLDSLSQAAFPSESFSRVQQQILDAISQRGQDPFDVAEDAFFSKLYAHQPYGHAVVGNAFTIRAITVEALKAFYQRFYVDQNAKIIMVGAVSKEKAMQLANTLASGLLQGPKAATLPPSVSEQRGGHTFVAMPVSQHAIFMGENAIRRDDPDYYNLMVANYIFGGSSMTSLLFDEVRNKKGLAYSVFSGFSALQQRGPFIITLQTRAPMSDQARAIVRNTLNTYLKQGPTCTQLDAAKRDLVGGFPLKIASNEGLLANVIMMAFYDLPLNYLLTYPSKIQAVTVLSAKKAFARNVRPDQFDTVVVGAKTNGPSSL